MKHYIAKTFTDENGRRILLSITEFPDIRSAQTTLRRTWKFQRRKNVSALPDETFCAEFLDTQMPGTKKRRKNILHLDIFEQYEDYSTSSYTSYILFPSKFLINFKKMYGNRSIRWQKCGIAVPCAAAAATFDENIPC